MFFLLFVVYPGTSLQICRLLQSCTAICSYASQVDCPSYLPTDPNIPCDTAEYRRYRAAAWFSFVLFVIGVPVACFAALRFHRARIHAIQTAGTTSVVSAWARGLSYLFESYRPGCYWWEVLEMARKMLLTSIILFISPSSYSQIVLGVALSVAFLWLVERFQPNVNRIDRILQVLVYAAITGTLLLGMAVRSANAEASGASRDADRKTLGALLILLNVSIILALVATIAAAMRQYRRPTLGFPVEDQSQVRPVGIFANPAYLAKGEEESEQKVMLTNPGQNESDAHVEADCPKWDVDVAPDEEM